MKKIPLLLILVLSISTLGFHPDPSGSLAGGLRVIEPAPGRAVFSQISFHANIETAGVVVSGSALPARAELLYRAAGETNWRAGHPLARIDNGQLIGSLFGLQPSTTYEVKVQDGTTAISGAVTTQVRDLAFTPVNVLHVNDDAPPGGDGSAAAPFKTIQEGVNRATPGTQVLVADGTYPEMVTFPASGSENNWIQVKAEGSGAILEGSETLTGNAWTQYQDKTRVWYRVIGTSIRYLARDGKRFYNYDTLANLLNSTGHGKTTMTEGWYLDPNTATLYIRSLDNPNNHAWQVPRRLHAFDMNAKDWIWIEGFEMRYYNRCGVCTVNASHLVVRRNKIHNIQLGIFFDWNGTAAQGNDTRIEYNEIYDPPVNEWPWKAVKGSSMEGTAIVVRGRSGAIVRNNDIHNFFNGIYTGSSGQLENSALAFDADIYENTIRSISDDALEPEGACINHRFRNNTIDSVFVGISLAPITQGPVWMLRSTITNYAGMAVKWDRNSDGVTFLYHNTAWTSVPNADAVFLISPVYNAVMRNNIFSATNYLINAVPSGSAGHDWNNDNWHTTRTADANHLKWANVLHTTLAKFCAASGLECNGYEAAPGLTNPALGDLTLLASSPNIDRGILIPGINDQFMGRAPDTGAFERVSDTPPAVLSIVRADATPSGAAIVKFSVTFSEPVSGVDTADFAPFAQGLSGVSVSRVTPLTQTNYLVEVNTGLGNGSLRLDLVDNDSILDSANGPLGGIGAGNGNFNGGDVYAIEKTIPLVSVISPLDAVINGADIVRFGVAFSEEVSGVDAGDFTLFMNGNLVNPFITQVTGGGAAYIVSVQTGSGDGTLRLDLNDDDSILDTTLNPLGGSGPGNGSYISGGAYTIDKTAPLVTSILRADASPTNAAAVRYTLTFSEPVSGVDAADFSVVPSDSLTGAAIQSVSGSAAGYSVIVSSGNGVGRLRLDLADNDSILDTAGRPLGGPGAGNGTFMAGQEYEINRPPVTSLTAAFTSNAANDGWVLELNETSDKGGSKNTNAVTFILGDDARDRMYRAILQFPTASLPDNAVIDQVILTIKRQGNVGVDPFNTHKNISIDIRRGAFGSFGPFAVGALQHSDFQAPADAYGVGVIQGNPVAGWYWSVLNASAHSFINLGGDTQFRLGFQIDDNDDRNNDYLLFFSGNSKTEADRPQLLIKYHLP